MRFAIVSETWPPEINGVALTVQGFARGLRELGHEVTVVRPRQPEATDSEGHEELLVGGAGLPRYPGLRFGFPASRHLLTRWHHARPDAVYVATEGPLGWSALRSARRLRIPVATGFHTRFDDYMGRYGVGFLAPLVFAWLRRMHNAADATLAPTEALASFLRERGFRQVQCLGRAVDIRRFDPARRSIELRAAWGLAAHDLAVIHVGRLAAEKNLTLAVRTFRALQAQHASARFVLVGDGPARAALQAANPDFVFAGMQRGDALAAHWASADLFLFPSLSETFGNVTLEAMASGVATVAFDYGAAREHLRDGVHGAAVECGDEAGFIGAALRLARDPELRQHLGHAARAAVAHLDPGALSRRFADLLTDLAQRRAA